MLLGIAACASRSAEKTTITDIRQLDGQTIGVMTGSTIDQHTDTYIQDAKVDAAANGDISIALWP